MNRDTIVAISTASGIGLRAVVRLSGPRAFPIAKSICDGAVDPHQMKGFSYPEVFLRLKDNRRLSARLLVMRAPKSYTTENMVEFHFVGAGILGNLVLEQCLGHGARLSEPGEFTKRAFLNGRIDAAQVEGVLRIIESRSEEERQSALRLLQGKASRQTREVRRDLVKVLASIEAYLDFTDEDSEAIQEAPLREMLSSCHERLERIGQRLGRRTPLHDLPRIVLLGPPNAGKSSLFKLLAPKAHVLISPEPGATRDLLEGEVTLKESRFLLYDAPGVCESENPLERLAISRLMGMMPRMDAGIAVLDGSQRPDQKVMGDIVRLNQNKPLIFVLNKSDLKPHPLWKEVCFENKPIDLSVKESKGIPPLMDALVRLAPVLEKKQRPGVDFQTRVIIENTIRSVKDALDADWRGGVEIVAMELKEALTSLGAISHQFTNEEVLEAVFSQFCIGK